MCLIAFAIGARSDLPLVIAANRDEYWERPTLALHAWPLPSGKTAYAGRDQLAGGTWLGVTQDGRIAMLTNVRAGLPEPAPRSRGELVSSWLDSMLEWEDWLQGYEPGLYGGFNLVLGDMRSQRWVWLSNCSPRLGGVALDEPCLPPGWHGHLLPPGLYGLSNAGLDSPWPKTLALKSALRRHLQSSTPTVEPDELLQTLLHMAPAPDEALPRTGVTLELERHLSSPFVHVPEMGYGTRSSMILHWHADARLDLQEWTHDPQAIGPASVRPEHWPLSGSRCSRLSLSI